LNSTCTVEVTAGQSTPPPKSVSLNDSRNDVVVRLRVWCGCVLARAHSLTLPV
jgi:ferredoxin